MEKNAIILFNGGLKSTVLLSQILPEFDNIYGLMFTHEKYDRYQREVANNIQHIHAQSNKQFYLAMSSPIAIDFLHYRVGLNLESPLNKTFGFYHLAIVEATIFAKFMGATSIYISGNELLPAFSINIAINLSNGLINLRAPFYGKSLLDIVQLGLELKAPTEHTRSCERYDITPCNWCESCRKRRQVFEHLNIGSIP